MIECGLLSIILKQLLASTCKYFRTSNFCKMFSVLAGLLTVRGCWPLGLPEIILIPPGCSILAVMADWKHIHVTTHWYSHCFQSRPTPKIISTNDQFPCKKTVVGRDWGHREHCSGGSYCAINPPCKYLMMWWRIGSTSTQFSQVSWPCEVVDR